MTRAPDTKLTPEVAREVCQRAGSKAYVAGSIAMLGSEYVLGLKAVNCQTGEPMAEELVTASSKGKGIRRVGGGGYEAAERVGRVAGKREETRCPAVAGYDVVAGSAEGVHTRREGEPRSGYNRMAALPYLSPCC